MRRVVAFLFVACGATAASADAARPSPEWTAVPRPASTASARVRVGIGHADRASYPVTIAEPGSTTALTVVQTSWPIQHGVQVELGFSAEMGYSTLGDSLLVPGAPALAVTWARRRGSSVTTVRALGGRSLTDGLTFLPANTSASMLAHDPMVLWSGADTVALQAALQGTTEDLAWAAAATLSDLTPRSGSKHQTLMRADVAVGGGLGHHLTWSVELGVSSDILDEEQPEGTDFVPLWNVGVHRHWSMHSVGLATAGGWIGGTRRDVLGPSILVDMRGEL